MTHRIPKPSWRFDFSGDDTLRAVPYFEEVANGLTKHMWEVEDDVLTTAVVDLLRSKGWTVVSPSVGVDNSKSALEIIQALEDAWNMMHFGCDNADHKAAYMEMARLFGYREARGGDSD